MTPSSPRPRRSAAQRGDEDQHRAAAGVQGRREARQSVPLGPAQCSALNETTMSSRRGTSSSPPRRPRTAAPVTTAPRRSSPATGRSRRTGPRGSARRATASPARHRTRRRGGWYPVEIDGLQGPAGEPPLQRVDAAVARAVPVGQGATGGRTRARPIRPCRPARVEPQRSATSATMVRPRPRTSSGSAACASAAPGASSDTVIRTRSRCTSWRPRTPTVACHGVRGHLGRDQAGVGDQQLVRSLARVVDQSVTALATMRRAAPTASGAGTKTSVVTWRAGRRASRPGIPSGAMTRCGDCRADARGPGRRSKLLLTGRGRGGRSRGRFGQLVQRRLEGEGAAHWLFGRQAGS